MIDIKPTTPESLRLRTDIINVIREPKTSNINWLEYLLVIKVKPPLLVK